MVLRESSLRSNFRLGLRVVEIDVCGHGPFDLLLGRLGSGEGRVRDLVVTVTGPGQEWRSSPALEFFLGVSKRQCRFHTTQVAVDSCESGVDPTAGGSRSRGPGGCLITQFFL